MYRSVSLSNVARNLALINSSRLSKVKSIASNFATQAEQKSQKDDHQKKVSENTIHFDQPMTKNKMNDFDIDFFMNDLEKMNLQIDAAEKQKYIEFFNQPLYLQLWKWCKVLVRDSITFLKTEMFVWYMFENEKYVFDRDIDTFWEFNKKEDIKRWMIVCDHDMDRGFSSCSLSVNKQGRLVFSGFLDCDKLPKDGIQDLTGYAHLSSPFKKTGFGLESYYNWSQFNHVMIRFRGDGRVYRILIRCASLQGGQTDSFYEFYLYTRGGPYWQTAKIPFSKFTLCYAGRFQEKPHPLMADNIQSFGFTVCKYSGPFRLEISHIGMMLDIRNYQDHDYEGYFRPEFV